MDLIPIRSSHCHDGYFYSLNSRSQKHCLNVASSLVFRRVVLVDGPDPEAAVEASDGVDAAADHGDAATATASLHLGNLIRTIK